MHAFDPRPSAPEARSDAALVSECLAGDEDCFGELMRRYSRAVYARAYGACGNRQDAEDLTQEVFLKVFRALASFDARRPFGPWILRITTNASVDLARSRRLEVALDRPVEESAAAEPDVEPSLEDHLAARQKAERTRALLAELPGREREVLELHYLAEVPNETLTTRFHLSVSGVKSRLHRARSSFRKRLLSSSDVLGLTFARAATRPSRSAARSRNRSPVRLKPIWSIR